MIRRMKMSIENNLKYRGYLHLSIYIKQNSVRATWHTQAEVHDICQLWFLMDRIKSETETIFEERMTKNFLKLMKKIKLDI